MHDDEEREDEREPAEAPGEDDLVEQQQGKGYGEDEGERPEALPE